MSDGFYYDESPYYDELTDELKESLKKSIKKEVLNKRKELFVFYSCHNSILGIIAAIFSQSIPADLTRFSGSR